MAWDFSSKNRLPEIEYGEEEIDIILHHELIHHKHHDLLWKAIL